ncbi:endoplasmic reticulum vesicle transporter-domain-containing protein [Lactifluus subvellereus]|nr:endoplasmic reticulum vesicle transporter-domain-containing protein [Lactifluus subvellereus]
MTRMSGGLFRHFSLSTLLSFSSLFLYLFIRLAPAKGFFGGLKTMDVFGKAMDDVKVRTRMGAFQSPTCHPSGLPAAAVLTTNIIEEPQRDVTHSVVKTRLIAAGTAVPGSQIGELRNDIDKLNGQQPPEGGCCNSCDAVREACVRKGWTFGNPNAIDQGQSSESCNVAGLVPVNEVVGNIHITPGHSFRATQSQIYDFVGYLKNDGNRHDFSHTIHDMYFTADDEADASRAQVSKEMRGRLGIYQNPLDEHMQGKATQTKGYKYITVLPACRVDAWLGVFLSYEISPILVAHRETRQSFAHFLTSTCAIVGGVLTVVSILNNALFATQRGFKKGATTNGHVSGKLT